jgi:hypothetical protein
MSGDLILGLVLAIAAVGLGISLIVIGFRRGGEK